MKTALLTIVIAMTSLSVSAQGRRDRDHDYYRPQPVSEICSYKLEAKYETRRYRRGEVVNTFTEFGPRSCMLAQDACEVAKMNEYRSWNFECTKDFHTGDRPQFGERCEYRIETRFGFEPEVYASVGFGACGIAQDQCERDLKVKRARGVVGPRATCVQTSNSRPTPRPRIYTASCTAAQFAGRVGRRTGIEFTETASARSQREAEQRACEEAMNTCQRNLRGRMTCEVVR